jgi:hypothetical protein
MSNLEQAARQSLDLCERIRDGREVWGQHELRAVCETLRIALAKQARPVGWMGWMAAVPADLVSDAEYIRIFDAARNGSDRPSGKLRGIRAVIAAYELATPRQAEPVCRADGRCQYAIDRGVEDLGHCPKGKCVMPKGEEQAEPVDLTKPNLAHALENCRLYAARHRAERWAEVILRFCATAGHTGNPLRTEQAEPVASEPLVGNSVMPPGGDAGSPII